jgi:hypothetical protein
LVSIVIILLDSQPTPRLRFWRIGLALRVRRVPVFRLSQERVFKRAACRDALFDSSSPSQLTMVNFLGSTQQSSAISWENHLRRQGNEPK